VFEGADTLNFMDRVCQVQRCSPSSAVDSSAVDSSPLGGIVVYTRIYGPMQVYSYFCTQEHLPLLEHPEGQPGEVGKDEDYWTTSLRFKRDVRSFFPHIRVDVDSARAWRLPRLHHAGAL